MAAFGWKWSGIRKVARLALPFSFLRLCDEGTHYTIRQNTGLVLPGVLWTVVAGPNPTFGVPFPYGFDVEPD